MRKLTRAEKREIAWDVEAIREAIARGIDAGRIVSSYDAASGQMILARPHGKADPEDKRKN